MPNIRLIDHPYQPSNAALGEDLCIDSTLEEIARPLTRTVKVELRKPPKRRPQASQNGETWTECCECAAVLPGPKRGGVDILNILRDWGPLIALLHCWWACWIGLTSVWTGSRAKWTRNVSGLRKSRACGPA